MPLVNFMISGSILAEKVKNRGICAGSASTSCPRTFSPPKPQQRAVALGNARARHRTNPVQAVVCKYFIFCSLRTATIRFMGIFNRRRCPHCIFRTFAFFACSWRQAFGPTTRISHLDRPWGSGFSVSCWGTRKKSTTKQDDPVSPLCLAQDCHLSNGKCAVYLIDIYYNIRIL